MSQCKRAAPSMQWLDFSFSVFLCLGALFPCFIRAEVVRIGGTGSGLETMNILAKSFQSKNPNFQFEVVPSLGSSGGIRAVSSRFIQIAVSNRLPKPAEAMAGMQSIEYAKTPFVFVTSKSGVNNLKLTEIADIYAGRQIKWSDGSPVRLVLRDLGDSDNTVLAAMSPEMKEAMLMAHKRKGMRIALSDQESIDAIDELSGSIGASTLALVHAEKRRAKVLSVNGVEPTIANLKNGRYPYSKDLYLIYLETNISVEVKRFLLFIRSAEGQRLMTQVGNLPVNAVR